MTRRTRTYLLALAVALAAADAILATLIWHNLNRAPAGVVTHTISPSRATEAWGKAPVWI